MPLNSHPPISRVPLKFSLLLCPACFSNQFQAWHAPIWHVIFPLSLLFLSPISSHLFHCTTFPVSSVPQNNPLEPVVFYAGFYLLNLNPVPLLHFQDLPGYSLHIRKCLSNYFFSFVPGSILYYQWQPLGYDTKSSQLSTWNALCYHSMPSHTSQLRFNAMSSEQHSLVLWLDPIPLYLLHLVL